MGTSSMLAAEQGNGRNRSIWLVTHGSVFGCGGMYRLERSKLSKCLLPFTPPLQRTILPATHVAKQPKVTHNLWSVVNGISYCSSSFAFHQEENQQTPTLPPSPLHIFNPAHSLLLFLHVPKVYFIHFSRLSQLRVSGIASNQLLRF